MRWCAAKFPLENGFSADSGGQADAARLFDRQAWVGLSTPAWGEFRAGRQNGPVQTRCGYNAGTNPDLRHFYNIAQVSDDFQVDAKLRVGALRGVIDDTSGRHQGATGAAVGAYYDLGKRTMLYTLAETLRNDSNAGFRPSGSAALKTNFSTPADVNGRRIDGLQLGVLHRF